MFSILQGKRVLKDVDQYLVSRQAALAIEQKIAEARITRFCQRACFADGRKGTIQVIRFKLLTCDLAKHFCW
jgi:glycerate kinase